ncbi:MAG: hypothetical protein ACLFPA_06250 [Dichotomicrobium sp.]
MDTQPSDQKRHIRQALADLVFGLALFVIFILLGVFGVKQASSADAAPQAAMPAQAVAAPLLREQHSGELRHNLLPLGRRTW